MIHFAVKMPLNLTPQQLGRLLFKEKHEPRRSLKRFLRDLGGDGSAEELNVALEIASKDIQAKSFADLLDTNRRIAAENIEETAKDRLQAIMLEVKRKMSESGLTQSDVATACGWSQPLLSHYLSGNVEPGALNLLKLIESVGCSVIISE
jgi:predicted XRE-type DNA-binding protein